MYFTPSLFVIAMTVETLTSSASAAWNLPHESHQMNLPKQTDASGTFRKQCDNSTLSTHVEGGWQSSPHLNASPNMIAEETEECKSASVWSVISNHSGPSFCQNERKSDTAATCRLFGIDLKSPSLLPLPENSPLISVDLPQDPDEVCTPSTRLSGSDQKSSVWKDSKELKIGQLQVPTKEVQSGHSHSSRSRTKVLDE